ncbi:MAG: MmgE/PrpD family protein [Eubacteriaceae bacterium]|nr:MmgE/PrpD family protein [Eubacteriaceae bacterium]
MDERLISPGGTDALCENLVNTAYEDLSEENVRIFRDRLLDMAGCIFGGATVKENDFLEERYLQWGGKEEARVFASGGKRLPLPNAAMLNALKARSNDYGSMLFKIHGAAMPSHVGETLLPLNLTLADHFGPSGRQFIANNVASEDLAGRLLFSLKVRMPADMLLITSAAAAVAGRYYGLDAAQMKSALSYAATNATDPAGAYYNYSEELYLHNGVSAQTGIMCAEYARGGWRGFTDPYFGRSALLSKNAEDGEYPENYEAIFSDLGKVYYTECAIKKFPGGIPMTSVAFAGRKLHQMILDRYGSVDPEKIACVHFFASRRIFHGYYSNPFVLRNHLNALFAYHFAAASSVMYGVVSVKTVQTEAIMADKELVRLAEEATMDFYEPAGGAPLVKVVAEMKDGTTLEAEESFMIMEDYPSRDVIIAKFMDQFNAYGKLPASHAEKIIELAGRVEEIGDMREFTELL